METVTTERWRRIAAKHRDTFKDILATWIKAGEGNDEYAGLSDMLRSMPHDTRIKTAQILQNCLAQALEEAPLYMLEQGVCCYCGCTDEHGCPEGCSWDDDMHTLCSSCAAALEQLRINRLGRPVITPDDVIAWAKDQNPLTQHSLAVKCAGLAQEEYGAAIIVTSLSDADDKVKACLAYAIDENAVLLKAAADAIAHEDHEAPETPNDDEAAN